MSNVVIRRNSRSREQWAKIINEDWRKTVNGVFQTADHLSEALEELGLREFHAMVREDLEITPGSVNRLVKIARSEPIKSASPPSLPASWTILYELTKLSAKDFKWAQERGLISTETGQREARAIAEALDPKSIGIVGENTIKLPAPKSAREIARETGRMVAASDGNVYSGATEEEGADATRRRQQTYDIRNAIETIADCPITSSQWIEQTEQWWLHEFRLASVDTAIEWLSGLRENVKKQNGVIDAEQAAQAGH